MATSSLSRKMNPVPVLIDDTGATNGAPTARSFVERHRARFAAGLVTLSMVGLSVTFPHAQARRDELGCDALCYGAMMSARSALHLVGSVLVGRLSDLCGRKGAMWLALLGG